MSSNTPQHQHSRSQSYQSHDNYYSATNAIYQSGQTLASVGASATPWTPTRNAASSQAQDTQQYTPTLSNGNGSVTRKSSLRYAPPAYQQAAGLPSNPYPPNPQSHRRSVTLGRINTQEQNTGQSGNAMSDVHHYGAPPSYGNENVPIHLQPSTPQHNSSASIPGALQPGQSSRPIPIASANTAPNLPTLPQISTQMQQQQQSSLAARPMTISQTHSYSRSSPSGLDTPKYKPFSTNAPESSKLGSPGGSYTPQSGQGLQGMSYSPLGLADIRSRPETIFSDTTLSPTIPSQEEEGVQHPTNSNYIAPWPIYAVDWCKWSPKGSHAASGKVAIGSYLEDNHNYIQILDAQRTQVDPENPHSERGLEFVKTAEATHAYPVTRILWEPPSSNKQSTDLLATSGDHLRLWSLPSESHNYQSNSINRSGTSGNQPLQKLSPLALLSNSKSPEHTAPITSLDWNIVQPSLIITSSIDTTCTIWDIPTLTAKTQLIAHDKEVFDVRFCANSVDVFVSCGADGSVRMFDLRSLEHSTIIYEPSEKTDKSAQLSPDLMSSSPTRGGGHSLSFPPPLLRIAASPHDAHLLATFSQDSSIIRVLDVRQPGQALLELKGHSGAVSCIEWCNTQRGLLASGADDCCVMLWDLMGTSAVTGTQPPVPGQQGTGQERGPSAAWECGYEVGNLSWAPMQGTLGVCGGRGLWGVQL